MMLEPSPSRLTLLESVSIFDILLSFPPICEDIDEVVMKLGNVSWNNIEPKC